MTLNPIVYLLGKFVNVVSWFTTYTALKLGFFRDAFEFFFNFVLVEFGVQSGSHKLKLHVLDSACDGSRHHLVFCSLELSRNFLLHGQ